MGERELAALATTQLSLVTRPQAKDHLSREQLKDRPAKGRFLPARWGIYRFAGTAASPWQELAAAAVASHRSAAVRWALPGVIEEGPEITVPWPMWSRLHFTSASGSSRIVADVKAARERAFRALGVHDPQWREKVP